MSITTYLRCNSCHNDFKTTIHEALPLKDLPDTCRSCYDSEVAEEIMEREVSMKFREATKHDNWYWEGDSLSYGSFDDEYDETIPSLPLLAAENPVHSPVESAEPEPDPLPAYLPAALENLIAALRSNRAY
jgi:hypothetical protein